jgi:micrococcal nuclease
VRPEPRGIRTRDRRFVFLRAFILVLLCVALHGCSVATSSGGERSETTVYRITDGDTVNISPEVRDNGTVRLIGVDTPERGEPLYEEAAAFAEDDLEGERVTLELDAEEEDDYGRLLAYVYGSDGSMFNEALVREGYAQVATFPPNTRYLDRFEKAQGEAREAGRGIWGLTEGEACQLRDRGNGIGGGCGG